MIMRTTIAALSFAALITFTGCTQAERNSAAREAGQETREAAEKADGLARKAGRAAHEVAQESKEAAAKAGKAIKQASNEAKAG